MNEAQRANVVLKILNQTYPKTPIPLKHNSKFTLSGDGDFAETKIVVGDSNTNELATDHNASGTFYIKYLLLVVVLPKKALNLF